MAAEAIAAETGAPGRVQSIDSARHPVARRVADTLRNRSQKPRVFIIDDRENIEQAVACGIRLDSLYAAASAAEDRFIFAADHPRTPLYILGDAVIGRLFGEQKRARVFALAHSPRRPRLRDLSRNSGDVIALDGVRLIGNIGATTRTACGLGAAGVVLLESGLRTVLDRRLIRASRGLVFATPVVTATREEFAGFVHREGLPVAALSAGATEPLNAIRSVQERLVISLGGERDGLSPEMAALATHRYAIPMASRVESLNVSVTAGIALYEHRYGRR
ncbi:TrmH family RNA methyltransferase [Leucobacter sp. wl10]|uniref:TrmH family RNA methyltransferase n=1 Tax=Leucobacter sp. wl10 TaxID=2304677 RepID=UPI000E5AFF7D|nr:TrmH family RNA methyltransferase [Leucobacter sp. wl10]RGE20718.1 hypothetical protein D1J51_08280 [Leucobacter sp. wl10]